MRYNVFRRIFERLTGHRLHNVPSLEESLQAAYRDVAGEPRAIQIGEVQKLAAFYNGGQRRIVDIVEKAYEDFR
jgi:hypothetical protein